MKAINDDMDHLEQASMAVQNRAQNNGADQGYNHT
jgi:hypothetical protein